LSSDDPSVGGRCDPTNEWDTFDTPTRDGAITIGDILQSSSGSAVGPAHLAGTDTIWQTTGLPAVQAKAGAADVETRATAHSTDHTTG